VKAPSTASVPKIDDYQVEDAARTIARAETHKADPALMKRVKQHVAKLSAAVGAGKPAKAAVGARKEMPRR